MLLDHTHPKLNSEITAIGGHYLFLKENILIYRKKSVLYAVGCAVFNSTCCGAGGIGFARVQGFLHAYQYKTDAAGDPVSLVEPIRDALHQQELRQIIQQKEMVHQVEFGC